MSADCLGVIIVLMLDWFELICIIGMLAAEINEGL